MRLTINISLLILTILFYSCSSEMKKETKEETSLEKKELKDPQLQQLMDELNTTESTEAELKDGFHEIKYPTGELKSTGTISNGKKEGLWTYYHENGTKWSECEFLNGKSHGKVVSYHPNGQIYYIGYFTNGVKSGDWMFYDDKGNLIKEEKMSK